MSKDDGPITGIMRDNDSIKKRNLEQSRGHDMFAGSLPLPDIRTTFLTIEASLTVEEARCILEVRTEEYVVIHRVVRGEHMYYLLPRVYIETRIAGRNPDEPMETALDLHEHGRTEAIPRTMVKKNTREVIHDNRARIVTDRDTVMGFIIPPEPHRAMDEPAVPPAPPAHKADVEACWAYTDLTTRTVHKKMRRGEHARPASAAGPGEPVSTPIIEASVSEQPCHFRAQMPEEVLAGETQQVLVDISRQVLDLACGVAGSTETLPDLATGTKLTVRLIPKLNFEALGDTRVDVTAPGPDKPVNLVFDVRPTAPGEGEIWVAFCQGPVSLLTLKLRPQIVVERSLGTVGSVQAAAIAESAPALVRVNTMKVYVQKSNGTKRYRYDLWLDSIGIDDTFESQEFTGDITALLGPYMEFFDTVQADTQLDFQQLQIQLKSIGARLFEKLFPLELQQVFWDNRNKIDHLKLYCEEPYIPWEILHVCEPGKPISPGTKFLGEMGMVRWLHGHAAPTELRVRPGRARYVTPNYPGNALASAQQEGKMLEDLFKAQPVKPPTRPELTKLISREGPFDLFHFAGHGEGSEEEITSSCIELEPAGPNSTRQLRDLTPDIVAGLCRLKAGDGTRPIVVLNTCRAGKTGYYITGLSGFAPAFLEREAGVFVGALWQIGDEPACSFIKEFYLELLKGKTVADAVKLGRDKACKAGDATYLAYVVYADPCARLVEKP
jgi:hypothetical protein